MKAEPSQVHLTSQKAVIDITSFWTLWVISTSPNPDEKREVIKTVGCIFLHKKLTAPKLV